MSIYATKHYQVHLFYRICYFKHTTPTFSSSINTFAEHLQVTKSNTTTAPVQFIKLHRYHFADIWFSTLLQNETRCLTIPQLIIYKNNQHIRATEKEFQITTHIIQ